MLLILLFFVLLALKATFTGIVHYGGILPAIAIIVACYLIALTVERQQQPPAQ